MGSAEAAELTKLAETTYRDVNIALANELARFADAHGHRHRPRDRRRQLASRSATSTARAWRSAGTASPSTRASTSTPTPRRACRAPRARSTTRCRRYAVELLEAELGDARPARASLILGVAYRGNVKETAFSGAFALRDELRRARRRSRWRTDPLYDDDELRALGFEPWDGATSTGAILQADHAAYTGPEPGRPARRARDRRRPRAARRRALRRRRRRAAAHRRRLSAQRGERRDDALAGVAVAVELGPLGGRRALQRGERRARVEVDEHVPAGLDGLDPLGRVAHRHARHAGQVGLLLHAARVGEHRAGARRAAR